MFIIFKHLVSRLGAVFIGIFGLTSEAADQPPAVELTLTPRLCVLGAAERECSGTVTVHWRAAAPLSVCLFQDGHNQPVHCWQTAASGEYTLAPRAASSARFYVASPEREVVLAEGWFQVLQQQNAHRKRRNPWSFY